MTSATEDSGDGDDRVHLRSDHPIYVHLHDTPEFSELRKRFRGFVFPATFAFMTWYLLYVVMSNWAGDFMGTKVFGNVNVALIFGLLQFVSTFMIAWLYARYAGRSLDPVADRLREEMETDQ